MRIAEAHGRTNEIPSKTIFFSLISTVTTATTVTAPGFGAISGGAAATSIQVIKVPLVSPWFWVPLVALGIYFVLG